MKKNSKKRLIDALKKGAKDLAKVATQSFNSQANKRASQQRKCGGC